MNDNIYKNGIIIISENMEQFMHDAIVELHKTNSEYDLNIASVLSEAGGYLESICLHLASGVGDYVKVTNVELLQCAIKLSHYTSELHENTTDDTDRSILKYCVDICVSIVEGFVKVCKTEHEVISDMNDGVHRKTQVVKPVNISKVRRSINKGVNSKHANNKILKKNRHRK